MKACVWCSTKISSFRKFCSTECYREEQSFYLFLSLSNKRQNLVCRNTDCGKLFGGKTLNKLFCTENCQQAFRRGRTRPGEILHKLCKCGAVLTGGVGTGVGLLSAGFSQKEHCALCRRSKKIAAANAYYRYGKISNLARRTSRRLQNVIRLEAAFHRARLQVHTGRLPRRSRAKNRE